jgi:hypothetical protein
VDSFMSQINSVFYWRFGSGFFGVLYGKQQLHAAMAFGTSISPHYKVQLSSDTWCLYNTSASQMNQLVTIFNFVCS